jgi:SGNH domain-containing protein
MPPSSRSAWLASFAALALLLSACSALDSSSGDAGETTPTRSGSPGGSRAPEATPRLPLVRSGPHAGAAVLAGDATASSGVSYLPPIAAAVDDVPAYWHRCHAPGRQPSVLTCTLGYTGAKPRKVVVLVGDSAAGGWMPPLDAIGKARHWKIITMLHSLCAWTGTMTINLFLSPEPYTACHTWGANALRTIIEDIRPDAVVGSDRPFLRTPNNPDGGVAASAEVGHGLAAYWRELMAHDISVVALRETPEPGRDMPQCLGAQGATRCEVPRSTAVVDITPVTVADRLVGGRETLIDMTDLMCTTTCGPVVGNVLVYRDKHHLTETFALTLAPYLERRLLRVPGLAGG